MEYFNMNFNESNYTSTFYKLSGVWVYRSLKTPSGSLWLCGMSVSNLTFICIAWRTCLEKKKMRHQREKATECWCFLCSSLENQIFLKLLERTQKGHFPASMTAVYLISKTFREYHFFKDPMHLILTLEHCCAHW